MTMTTKAEIQTRLREVISPAALRNARRDGRLHSFDWQPLRALLPELTPEILNHTELEPGFLPLAVLAGAAPVPVVRDVLTAGADSNSVCGEDGVPAIITATGNSDPSMIQLLISHGAEVNARTGMTALHHAVHASERHVRLLLDAGADPLALSVVRETPIDSARKRIPRDLGIEAMLIEAARLRLAKTKGSALKLMRTAKPGGLQRFVKRRHDAGLRFLLLAAKLPVSEVAHAVSEACGGLRVESHCASRRVFGASGVFVVRRKGSPWSLAYLSLGAPRPDVQPAQRLARAWAQREVPIDAVVFRSGVVKTWRGGLEETRLMAETRRDLSLLDEHVSGPQAASLGAPIADWSAFLADLELTIDDALDASNGVELVLEIEAKKSEIEEVCVVVMEE